MNKANTARPPSTSSIVCPYGSDKASDIEKNNYNKKTTNKQNSSILSIAARAGLIVGRHEATIGANVLGFKSFLS